MKLETFVEKQKKILDAFLTEAKSNQLFKNLPDDEEEIDWLEQYLLFLEEQDEYKNKE